jgi:hypothetical protein
MAQQNRGTIKTFFETGDIPTEAQFGDSFDSQVFWVDDVETTLGNTDTKVPTSKAVNDTIVYTKDAGSNVFYRGVVTTLGSGCLSNIFHQTSSAILGASCQFNIFNQATDTVLGTGCENNVFNATSGTFTFGNNLKNLTVLSGSGAANYTNLTNYGFMYNLAYPSEIFRNPENTANYHRYYDPTNDRIVLTNLTTLVVSDIGGGGGGGDVYLANDQTFTGENTFAIGSGSKEPIIVTKGGNGAGIKVTKSSGSGDAIEVAQGSLSIADETASRIASFDGSKRVKSLDTATYPSLTELAYVKGVTSAIQTQLNSRRKTVQSTGLGTAVNGTTVETFCKAMLIPANTFAVGDIPMLTVRFIKGTSSLGNITGKIYVNTVASYSSGSPILLATTPAQIASTRSFATMRNIAIQSATESIVTSATTANSIEEAVTAAAETTMNIDWTIDQYIVVTITLGSGSDTGNCRYIMFN